MTYKTVITLCLLLLVGIITFKNLGTFVDVTREPQRSDLIVALGGGGGERIKKALELYREEFSLSHTFIYTGGRTVKKDNYLLQNGVEKHSLVAIDTSVAINTMEEVFFIKEYMLKHHFKSVIFVSSPQHSRRISVLAEAIAGYRDAGLQFMVASCEPERWRSEDYYTDKMTLKHTLSEVGKLAYNLLKYATPIIWFTQYTSKKKSGAWEKMLNALKPSQPSQYKASS